MSSTSSQSHPPFAELFKHVDKVPLALFEHLDCSFLKDFPVFAPDLWGRKREHDAPELFKESSAVSAEISTESSKSPMNSKMSSFGDSVALSVHPRISLFVGSSPIFRLSRKMRFTVSLSRSPTATCSTISSESIRQTSKLIQLMMTLR